VREGIEGTAARKRENRAMHVSELARFIQRPVIR
jgi:hypothetical protein